MPSTLSNPDTFSDNGVLYGFQCTAQGGNTKVDFRAGGIRKDGAFAALASLGNVTVPANSDPSLPQKTVYAVDASGTPTISAATMDPGDMSMLNPSVVFGLPYFKICEIVMPASTSVVAQSYIYDARNLVTCIPGPYPVSGLWVGASDALVTSNAWASGDCFLYPVFFSTEGQIANIGCWPTVAGTAGSKARLGIYREANDDGSAGLKLVVDAGQVAVDTTGAQTIGISGDNWFGPGWHWLALAFQSLGVTKPTMQRGATNAISPVGAASFTQGARGFRYVSGITGSLPSTISNASSDFSKTIGPLVMVQWT